MNHVLFISYDGLTDPLGQSQIIPYLKGLTHYGFRFTIISCEKPDRFQRFKSHINTLLSAQPIRWVPLTYHHWPPIFSTVYDLHRIKRTARKIHASDKINMVHTRSGTPALAGLWLKQQFGIKFLNDVRDFYSQSRVDSGQWPQNKFVYKKVFNFFLKNEKQELANSDGIVCLTHKAANILRSAPEYRPNTPLTVIPCSVDLDLFDPQKIADAKKEALLDKFGFRKEDLIVTYLGSVGTWYLAVEMFSFFKSISQNNPAAKLLVISPDDGEKILTIAMAAGIMQEKIAITSATREEVPGLLSLSTFSLFFIKPCDSKQASSPTKLGEIMAMGIPVITNDGVGDVRAIVEKYNAGIVLKSLDNTAFNEAIGKMNETYFDSKRIRKGASDYFDLQEAVEKYRKIYCSILNPDQKKIDEEESKNATITTSA